MKQIEITVQVNNTLEEIDSILKNQKFKLIRRSKVKDKYMTTNLKALTKENILTILSKCVLLRYLNVDNKNIFKKITYKNKQYKDNIVISEEKISINIDDLENAEKLFSKLGFETIINVNYDVIVYEKNGLELALQNVENLGLLLEYESPIDYSNFSDEKILKEKEKMQEEIKKLNINIGNNYDIKKAYELVLMKMNK